MPRNPRFVALLADVRADDSAPLLDDVWASVGVQARRPHLMPALFAVTLLSLARAAVDELAVLEGRTASSLVDEMLELHDRKNADYASDDDPLSNFEGTRHVGIEPLPGCLARMCDKHDRREQLRTGKTLKNEPIRDSLIDLAVYSTIAVMLLERQVGGELV